MNRGRALHSNTLLRRGFTIVELLIVIVVIAILAAITVVAYGGIQKQAQSAMYAASVDDVEKQILLAVADGRLAISNQLFGATCYGKVADFPAGDGFIEGECFSFYIGETKVSSMVVNASSPLTSIAFNDPSARAIKNPTVRKGSYNARGIWLTRATTSTPGKYAVSINWLAPDDSTCGRASNPAEANEALLADLKKIENGQATASEIETKYQLPAGYLTEETITQAIASLEAQVNTPQLCSRVVNLEG